MNNRPRLRLAIAAAPLMLASCAHDPPPQPPSPASPESPSADLAAASATVRASSTPPGAASASPLPPSCGALDCRLFDSPDEAFSAVLESEPLVLAVGESHKQKGMEHIDSSTKCFTEALLPKLPGRATDLVLELWVGAPRCGPQVARVEQEQKPVTRKQASTNQNEFVTLAQRAKDLGIQPHVLRPSCEQYDRIMQTPKEERALAMLGLITRQSATLVGTLLLRRDAFQSGSMVVAYGGAMHNDLRPRAGREDFSFGPELERATDGRYVELDIIVPEFIADTESWRALAWYAHFDPEAHPRKTTLLQPNPGSYVLIFPRSG